MNRRTIILGTGVLAIVGFATAGFVYNRNSTAKQKGLDLLVRPYSPILGPVNAPVTIVEFFDPACETCRAMHPVVKRIMAEFPEQVRVVIRYTPLHDGSIEVVRMLEAARKQNVYLPVLEAILAKQPEWAQHGTPRLDRAWAVAGAAGLGVQQARAAVMSPEITAIVSQDVADVKEVRVTKTPTFFVNGKPLPSFGAQQLYDLVRNEVNATPKSGAGQR